MASVVLGMAAPLLGIRRPARGDVPRLAACALTGMAGYQFLLNAGERTVSAGTASLLVNTGPIFAALLAWMLLSRRPPANTWAGIAIAFTGATIITLGQNFNLDVSINALLVLAAAASQATFFVLEKPLLERYTALEVTCYATWLGTLIALPALVDLTQDLDQTSPISVVSIVFLGAGASAVGFATWAYALARLEVATAANFLYLVPPVAIGVGWLVLGEVPAPTALAGGLIIITGVAISRRSGKRSSRPAVAGKSSDEPTEGSV